MASKKETYKREAYLMLQLFGDSSMPTTIMTDRLRVEWLTIQQIADQLILELKKKLPKPHEPKRHD